LTCNNRFVTAPWLPNESTGSSLHDPQRRLWQEARLSDCGLFDLVHLPYDPERPGDLVAFRTCAGMVVTAGDGNWTGEMQWAVVAETSDMKEWEKFTLEPQR
jgi:hypothetical protein